MFAGRMLILVVMEQGLQAAFIDGLRYGVALLPLLPVDGYAVNGAVYGTVMSIGLFDVFNIVLLPPTALVSEGLFAVVYVVQLPVLVFLEDTFGRFLLETFLGRWYGFSVLRNVGCRSCRLRVWLSTCPRLPTELRTEE